MDLLPEQQNIFTVAVLAALGVSLIDQTLSGLSC